MFVPPDRVGLSHHASVVTVIPEAGQQPILFYDNECRVLICVPFQAVHQERAPLASAQLWNSGEAQPCLGHVTHSVPKCKTHLLCGDSIQLVTESKHIMADIILQVPAKSRPTESLAEW